jgi:hypothetical protein
VASLRDQRGDGHHRRGRAANCLRPQGPPEVVLRRTAYDTYTATATLSATAGDMPGIEFITGNIQASASDAEALAAFNEAIEHQARQR